MILAALAFIMACPPPGPTCTSYPSCSISATPNGGWKIVATDTTCTFEPKVKPVVHEFWGWDEPAGSLHCGVDYTGRLCNEEALRRANQNQGRRAEAQKEKW